MKLVKNQRPFARHGTRGAVDRSWEMLIRYHRTEILMARQGFRNALDRRPLGGGGGR